MKTLKEINKQIKDLVDMKLEILKNSSHLCGLGKHLNDILRKRYNIDFPPECATLKFFERLEEKTIKECKQKFNEIVWEFYCILKARKHLPSICTGWEDNSLEWNEKATKILAEIVNEAICMEER